MSIENEMPPPSFPAGWPSDCPPCDALDAKGEVFRLVKNDPPAAEDLRTHNESGKRPKAPPCLRCGLSVFREMKDAAHQRLLMPRLGSHIARSVLLPIHGKTKLTHGMQPTHTTWWAYDGVVRESLFFVMKEEG